MPNKNVLLMIIPVTLFLITINAEGKALTPQKNPKNHSFYLCYKNKTAQKLTLYSNYFTYQYHACTIRRLPCQYKGGDINQTFGKFTTYPHALNAFYRCASFHK